MLENLKRAVLSLAQRAERAGLCLHKTGNFSARDPQSGLIAITPSGVDRMTSDSGDICIMEPNGKVVEIREGQKPTSETLLHLRAYNLRPDVRVVAHTHSRHATAMAVLRREIPPIVYEVMVYGGKVPLAPYGRPGTNALADSIDGIIPHYDVCLLAAHGVLAVGTDIESVYLKALYVEETAALYHLALSAGCGKEPPVISLEEIKAWKYPKEIEERNR